MKAKCPRRSGNFLLPFLTPHLSSPFTPSFRSITDSVQSGLFLATSRDDACVLFLSSSFGSSPISRNRSPHSARSHSYSHSPSTTGQTSSIRDRIDIASSLHQRRGVSFEGEARTRSKSRNRRQTWSSSKTFAREGDGGQ